MSLIFEISTKEVVFQKTKLAAKTPPFLPTPPSFVSVLTPLFLCLPLFGIVKPCNWRCIHDVASRIIFFCQDRTRPKRVDTTKRDDRVRVAAALCISAASLCCDSRRVSFLLCISAGIEAHCVAGISAVTFLMVETC